MTDVGRLSKVRRHRNDKKCYANSCDVIIPAGTDPVWAIKVSGTRRKDNVRFYNTHKFCSWECVGDYADYMELRLFESRKEQQRKGGRKNAGRPKLALADDVKAERRRAQIQISKHKRLALKYIEEGKQIPAYTQLRRIAEYMGKMEAYGLKYTNVLKVRPLSIAIYGDNEEIKPFDRALALGIGSRDWSSEQIVLYIDEKLEQLRDTD